MSTPANQVQLEQILTIMQEVRAELKTDRLFQVLEIIRDHVSRLSHEHAAIRDDLREILKAALAPPAAD